MDSFELTPEQHHFLGIAMNQQTWKLLGKNERSEKEELQMEHFALSSLFHWHRSPNFTPVNAQRGHWMLSHVYAVLQRPEEALKHALECHELTTELGLQGFDRAYSLEAMSRSHAANGYMEQARDFFALAEKAGEQIEGEKDRGYFVEDLHKEPWFGLRSEVEQLRESGQDESL